MVRRRVGSNVVLGNLLEARYRKTETVLDCVCREWIVTVSCLQVDRADLYRSAHVKGHNSKRKPHYLPIYKAFAPRRVTVN